MRKLTRKSLDELAKIYPVLSEQEQRGYVAGTSPTGSVTGVARDCDVGDCTFFHDPNEHNIVPVIITSGGSGSYNGGGGSPSGISPTGNFSENYYNGVNYGWLTDYINNSNSSNPTTPAIEGGGGGGGGNGGNNTSNKIRYDFGGDSESLSGWSEGRAYPVRYTVVGSCIRSGMDLNVVAIAHNNCNFKISAKIEVYQNEQLIQQIPLTHSPYGEIWPTGTESLGGASITLPSSGKIKVEFVSYGGYDTGTGNNSEVYESIVYSN